MRKKNKNLNDGKVDLSGQRKLSKDELKSDRFYYEGIVFDSNYGLDKKQIKKQLRIRKKGLDSKSVGNLVLIRMMMGNGMVREFIMVEDKGFFYYNKSMYVLDNAMKYYLIDRKIWSYDFHEYLSIPLKKSFVLSDKILNLIQPVYDEQRKKPVTPNIDTNEIKTVIENSGVVDVEASLNPTTLRRFTDSEVIKQVLQGAMLGRIFKVMFILIVITAVFMLILIILQLYTSGILDKIGSSLGFG